MSSARRPLLSGTACAAAVVLLLGGCASTAEEMIEQSTGTEVDMDADGTGLRIETDEGSFTASSGSDLPQDFPDVVVLPEGYAVMTSSKQDLEGQVGYILIGSVDADPADVADQIEGAYDVEPTQSAQVGDVRTLEYSDVDGMRIGYTINVDADGRAVVTVAAHPVPD